MVEAFDASTAELAVMLGTHHGVAGNARLVLQNFETAALPVTSHGTIDEMEVLVGLADLNFTVTMDSNSLGA
eukprot:COSAG01_NODE_17236_length_1167_cov_3.360487_1_plen_72_part_00